MEFLTCTFIGVFMIWGVIARDFLSFYTTEISNRYKCHHCRLSAYFKWIFLEILFLNCEWNWFWKYYCSELIFSNLSIRYLLLEWKCCWQYYCKGFLSFLRFTSGTPKLRRWWNPVSSELIFFKAFSKIVVIIMEMLLTILLYGFPLPLKVYKRHAQTGEVMEPSFHVIIFFQSFLVR